MTQKTLQVPEVHCNHCKTSIEGAVTQLQGINTVDVAVSEATVAVDYDDAVVDLDRIKQTIEEQGYVVFG